MSEIQKCPECECDVIQHSSKDFYALHYNPVGSREKCYCPRTYESLVEVKRIPETEESKWQSPIYYGKTDASLQLLVIDLGDSCVVKVEKGEFTWTIAHTFNEDKSVLLTGRRFTELCEAIEQQAILLRCPFCDGEGFWQEEDADRHYYAIHCNGCEARTVGVTTQELAIKKWNARPGKPIWKGGEWRKLNKTYDEQVDDVPLTVWRYTKENK